MERNGERNASRGSASLPTVLWVTNIAAPYRAPVWGSLGEETDLTVALLESNEQRKREGRRGDDWRPEAMTAVRSRTLRTIKYRRGELSLFTLVDAWPFLQRRPAAVLLGGWESPAYWQLFLAARLTGVRTVGFYESTLHTNRHRSGLVAAARRWFFKHLDAVVVPGIAAERAILEFGVAPDRVFRGFNAVDVSKIASRARSSPRNASPGSHAFLFVGQLIHRKQPDVLLRAFAAVRRDADTLQFVGDGPLRASLEREAEHLGIAGHVTFTGSLDNDTTIDVIVASDTLVLPSVEEVWGLVVNEALAAGLHAVVTQDSGVSASVSSMRGVYLTAPDEIALGAAMEASRADYAGPIEEPEILRHTPLSFAQVFLKALFTR